MPHSFSNIVLHIIFATKERYRWLNFDIRKRLYEYISGIVRNMHGEMITINGTEDHIHLLVIMPKNVSNSDFIRTIKANSSRWIHETFDNNFAWQTGYGAFSVSKSNIPVVQKYIENQENHHKKIDYEEEFRKFLKVHGFDVQEYHPKD